jgi:mRNA deadenylase 3'-5' endonuclease subunit Ccr4
MMASLSSDQMDGPAFSAEEPMLSLALQGRGFTDEGAGFSLGKPPRGGGGPSSGNNGNTGESGTGLNSTTSSASRLSLRQRRSGNAASLGLDIGTIQRTSRDKTTSSAVTAQFRGWTPTSQGPPIERLLDPTTFDPRAVRLLAYNILAARYTSTDKYVQCPVWALAEPYRLKNIACEIRGAQPDIVVFEECSATALESDELGGALKQMGYTWFHVPITTDKKERPTSDSQGSGNWAPSERPDHEGVAIVWRASRFQLHEELPLRFNTLAQRDEKLQADEKRRVMVGSHNVAAVVALQDTLTGTIFLVGGIHCFWDTAKPECQLYQIVRLLQHIEELNSTYIDLGPTTVFVAGDFNSEMRSAAMSYVLTGSVQQMAAPMRPFPANVGSKHDLELDTAYRDYARAHQNDGAVTAVGGGFAGVIDHIFYQPKMMRCVAVGKLAPADEIPNPAVPSDHYPVSAWFVPF